MSLRPVMHMCPAWDYVCSCGGQGRTCLDAQCPRPHAVIAVAACGVCTMTGGQPQLEPEEATIIDLMTRKEP
jgi:hypothetical protein